MNISLEELHLHMFRGCEDIKLGFSEVTEIYGRNSSGKSSLADAFAFVFTGYNYWGNKISSAIHEGQNVMWVSFHGRIDGSSVDFRRIQEAGRNGTKNLVTGGTQVDKSLFLSMVNPRYFVSLSPADAKDVLMRAANWDTEYLPVLWPEKAEFFEAMAKKLEVGSQSLLARWQKLDEYMKGLKQAIKSNDEQRLATEGKIAAYEQSMAFFKDNGIAYSTELEESVDMFALAAQQTLINLFNDKENLKKAVKEAETYRSFLVGAAVKNIESELGDVKIQLEDSKGKDCFVVTYKGMDYKALSNSAQLLAGLEIVNALEVISDSRIPCFIDNAEALQVQDMGDYPSIPQFAILNVADTDLSVYESGTLKNPVTLSTMLRSKETLVPNTKIIGDWGKKIKKAAV